MPPELRTSDLETSVHTNEAVTYLSISKFVHVNAVHTYESTVALWTYLRRRNVKPTLHEKFCATVAFKFLEGHFVISVDISFHLFILPR
jgi:hypothetical protein